MKRVLFLLGTFDKNSARTGVVITDQDFNMLDDIAKRLDVEVEIAWAVPEPAGRKKPTMATIRGHRDDLIAHINQLKPDVVMACGPLALQCLYNKGNVPVRDHQRELLEIPDLPGIVCAVTQSMEMVAAKPGVSKWLVLDTLAALHGNAPTQWGDYTILMPGTPEWAQLPAALAGKKVVGFDLETYPGLNPYHPDARIRMAMISDRPGRSWIVQLKADSKLPAWLRKIVTDPGVSKGGSNIKFDYKWLRRFGVEMVNMFDTSTAEHVLDCTSPLTDLKSLTFIYLPKLGDYSKGNRELLLSRGGKDRWDLLEDHEMYQYAGGDGEASVAAMKGQMVKLKKAKLTRPFALSMGLYSVLARMEADGACVSMEVNRELDAAFAEGMQELRQELVSALGPVNLNSPTQLVDALIEAVPGIDLTKQKIARQFADGYYRLPGDKEEDEYSTDKTVLEREALKYPIVNTLMMYRRYAKLHGTYVASMHDKHACLHPDGQYYVHTSYRTDIVETYRLSSQDPNLQNIPRKPDPEDDLPIPPQLNIKRQYISRFPGGVVLEGDLSQAEIRVAAHLSKDPLMIEAILHGEDIHRAMCSKFMNKPENEVTKLERTTGKRTNFLVIYGGGANTLSRQLGIPKVRAKDLLAQYFGTFSKLNEYMELCGFDVMRNLYSESEFGYRRLFRAPTNWEQWDGWRIKRQAWNHRVQNGAACCTFVAMMDAEAQMRKLKLKSIIDMQVHDSIKVDVYPGELDVVAPLIKNCLEHPSIERFGVNLCVPLVADLAVGPSWGEMEEFSV